MSDRKTQLRQAIMRAVKANGVKTDDVWFGLIFRTKSELKAMCRELNIKEGFE